MFTGKNKEDFEKWIGYNCFMELFEFDKYSFRMQQGVYLEFVREERGVLIQVYNNASGYLWQMAKVEGGTDLGWSEFDGNCEMLGSYKTYNDALSHAIKLENKGGLEEFKKRTLTSVFHWGNYVSWLKGLTD